MIVIYSKEDKESDIEKEILVITDKRRYERKKGERKEREGTKEE